MVKIDKSMIGYQFKSDKEDAVITVTKTGIEVSIGKDKRNRRGDLFRFDSFTKKDDHVYDSMITNQISFDKLMKDLLLDERTGTVFHNYAGSIFSKAFFLGIRKRISQSVSCKTWQKRYECPTV